MFELFWLLLLLLYDELANDVELAEDGKEMNLDLSNMRITQVVEEVDRHSRTLARKEELLGN